jgi:predicted aspartyl protease
MPDHYSGHFDGVHPVVWLELGSARYKFMLDTGFGGDLLVNELQAAQAKLTIVGELEVRWFDGSVATVEIARGYLNWFGRHRPCKVLVASRGLTLVGMELLKETRLEISFNENSVKIYRG